MTTFFEDMQREAERLRARVAEAAENTRGDMEKRLEQALIALQQQLRELEHEYEKARDKTAVDLSRGMDDVRARMAALQQEADSLHRRGLDNAATLLEQVGEASRFFAERLRDLGKGR